MDAEATARKQKHVAEEYLSSLSDLQCNSKPLINMLTMLAEENIDYAPIIVKVVEQHIAKVPTDLKLPILYLIDSIVKNVQSSYVALFGQCIVNIFCGVFERVNEKVRERMYALRQTWNEVFPASKLYSLDVRVKQIDKNWPITAVKQQPTAIHVNPNFLKSVPNDMEELLQAKTRELLELKKRKLELELEATKKHIEEQQKQLAKASDNVVPPPDSHIDSGILGGTSTQLTPIIPVPSNVPATTHVNPAHLASQTQIIAPIMPPVNNAGIYNPNYVRPSARMVLPPQKGPMQIVQQVHAGLPAKSNPNKIKVHPVTPALLNSKRHRDPRLMRQLQQQKPQTQSSQQSEHHGTVNTSDITYIEPHLATTSTSSTSEDPKRERRSSSKSSKSSRYNSGSESTTKSPTHHSSSHRSSKSSSSSSSTRSKDRERKRSTDLKTAMKSNDRRYSKTGNSNSSSSKYKSEKDIHVGATSPVTVKQHRSPSGSPTKMKESKKRHQAGKPTINNSSKNGVLRCSNSPDDIVSSSSTKDIDLRADSTASDPSTNSTVKTHSSITTMEPNKKGAVKGLEQNIKKDLEPRVVVSPTIQDMDLRQLISAGTVIQTIPPQSTASTTTSTSTLSNVPLISLQNVVPVEIDSKKNSTLDKGANLGINVDRKTPVVDASSSSTKSPTPKVSFKIQKSFNKLAKSTETLSTAKTTTSSTMITMASLLPTLASLATLENNSEDKNSKKSKIIMDSTVHEMDIDEQHSRSSRNSASDGKKRISETGATDEPMAKKSKSAKMDALFGSEDVDLRTLPPPILTKPIMNEVLTPPPPPNISSSDDDQQEVIKNRESKASKSATHSSASAKIPSTFEDVRAKFAKATRLSRLEKSNEKTNEKARQKLTELNTNEDETTQEAEDEKIRIILSQAQEMLESNSLNQGQYKQLVQTVMSLNEKNKLKEAKRRESLQQQNVSKNLSSKDVIASPRIDDDDNTSTSEQAARDAVLRKRIPKLPKTASNVSDDLLREEDSRDGGSSGIIAGLNKLKPKEKRLRHTKWSDRNADSQTNVNQNALSQRGWMAGPNGPNGGSGGGGKRPNLGMRGSSIPPPPQAPQPPMILGPNAIHPMHGTAGNWSQSGNVPNRPIVFGNQMPLIRSSVPPPPQPPQMSIPPVLPALTPNGLPKPCNSIDNPQAELVRTITIDGQSKDIRIYDDVAIVFMELDEPREIGFQPGQRAIIIDNQEPVTLRFNDEYRPIVIAGEQHRVRFGFPSRELYIDEHWYEIYFGGSPVSIPINNRIHVLKAEGPPPQVNIGPLRYDLVVGKIHMIVEAVNLFPLFLDARIQMFRLDDREHTVQFADNLLTVLLDGQPNQVEYGGLPKSFNLSGKRYFIRFTTLPKGVVAGKVEIKDMIYVKTEPPKKIELTDPLPISESTTEDNQQPIVASMDVQLDDVKTDEKIKPPVAVPADVTKSTDTASCVVPPIAATTALGKINIDELFQKLVSSGILNNNVATTSALNTTAAVQDVKTSQLEASVEAKSEENMAEKEEEKLPPIIPIDLRKPESIKTRQEAIISTLYSGMQCSSCGVRFPPEQTIKYSQHLDWHFRQNRRERDSTRKAHSRKWYYELSDWLQYEEIEDLEEREKNFFETQQNELEAIDDASNQRSTNSPLPSCPAGPDDVDRVCDMCQEKFEQFYNEELEEWHLRSALRVEDKIYHPLCYEDYKSSLNPPTVPETDDHATKPIDDDVIMNEDDNAVDVVIKIEDEKGSDEEPSNSDVIIAEEDDDVIVLPNEEPSVTEIVDDDDEEYVPVNVTREEMRSSLTNNSENEEKDESAMESDVEIQEPNIPFTDLDTYEEKELPGMDENSQASFLNVKIKEEPKDDEDEDDGFEDVGTVMYGPHDEISIQSSEETQTQTIISSTDSPLTVGGEISSSANIVSAPQTEEQQTEKLSVEVEDTVTAISDESNLISIDGNLEPTDGLNLSSAGLAPAVPLGSLVNKIKINITKNMSAAATSSATVPTTAASTSTSSSAGGGPPSASGSATATTSTELATTTTSSLNINNSNNSTKLCNVNTITNVVSTIPVLCAGGTLPSSNNIANNSNISNITVIGSYGSYHKPQHHHHHQQSVPILSTPANTVVSTSTNNTTTTTSSFSTTTSTNTRQSTPSPPVPEPAPVPVEETIVYELKPALKKATLKKMKKVECGIETSGLCSIM